MMKLVFAVEYAIACSVCVGGEIPKTVVNNYVLATVLMSLLPIGAFGGFLWYYKSRQKKMKEQNHES